MDLQHVDIGTQSLDAGVDGIEDVLARETNTVHKAAVVVRGGGDGRHLAFIVNTEEALGEDDNTVTGDVVLLQSLSEDFLRLTVGVDIGLGMTKSVSINLSWAGGSTYRIPGVDTTLVSVLDQRKGFFLVQNPVLPLLGTVGHGTQDDLGDLEAGVSESVNYIISRSS